MSNSDPLSAQYFKVKDMIVNHLKITHWYEDWVNQYNFRVRSLPAFRTRDEKFFSEFDDLTELYHSEKMWEEQVRKRIKILHDRIELIEMQRDKYDIEFSKLRSLIVSCKSETERNLYLEMQEALTQEPFNKRKL